MRVYEMENNDASGSEERAKELARYQVLYGKASTKKHKSYEGDGILCCFPQVMVLKSEDERSVISRSTSMKNPCDLYDGTIIKMGCYEVQIQERLSHLKQRVDGDTEPCTSTPNPSPMLKRVAVTPIAQSFVKKPCIGSRSFVCPIAGSQQEQVPPMILYDNGDGTCVELPAFISRHLREHQKEGATAIVRRIKEEKSGFILADDMGLGKSIQVIAATWALIKSQGFSISKCLIIVPSTLIFNWLAEFVKWFRGMRTPVIDMKKPSDIIAYKNAARLSPYFLCSYEMAVRYASQLEAVRFDVLVCDEAHRLKNSSSKLHLSLAGLGIGRRVLLTGTPVQNDLDEFYALLNFASPGIFKNIREFRKLSCGTGETFNDVIKETLLRRTSDVNKSHLPNKYEYVIFCRPSPLQCQTYKAVCDHMTGEPLVLISMLRKIANHPFLLYSKLREDPKSQYGNLITFFPQAYECSTFPVTSESGKASVLLAMIGKFALLGECTVVVSNSTKTLDLLSKLVTEIGLGVLRLDGATSLPERQRIVNDFNSARNPARVFFLSTKAGGVGLNLIAASRLILYDSDWNPASDLQAMARIWRDGQLRTCHIYRLITSGTIDEKIFQRQVKKTGLGSVINFDNITTSNVKFSEEDLLDIFSFSITDCSTHELLECPCQGNGLLPEEMDDEKDFDCVDMDEDADTDDQNCIKNEENYLQFPTPGQFAEEQERNDSDNTASMAELFRWRHFSPSSMSWSCFAQQSGLSGRICDSSDLNESHGNDSETGLDLTDISFVFQYSSKF